MRREGFWLGPIALWVCVSASASLAGGVQSESEWSALYKEVKNDLWKGIASKREKAVARIGEANWPGAVKTLLDFLKKPVPRLILLERRKRKIMKEIEKIMKLHDNQGGLARKDSNRMNFLQEDLKGINETLFRENRIKRLAARLLGGFTQKKAVDLILKEALSNRSWRVRLWRRGTRTGRRVRGDGPASQALEGLGTYAPDVEQIFERDDPAAAPPASL